MKKERWPPNRKGKLKSKTTYWEKKAKLWPRGKASMCICMVGSGGIIIRVRFTC
jgi:hypothetical protein